MTCDFYRYLAEIGTNDERESMIENYKLVTVLCHSCRNARKDACLRQQCFRYTQN